MRTIGLLGGMSWESTAVYYQKLNRAISQQLGALHSAKVVMWSVDFQEIESLQQAGDWQRAGEILIQCAKKLEMAGADAILICTNTMHIVAEQIQNQIGVPLLHIADSTAQAIQKAEIKKVGLLGTAFTMEMPFYKGRLQDKFGLEVVVPEAPQRQQVHDIIYQELCLGQVTAASKQVYLDVVEQLEHEGAEAIIMGCTEIGLLLSQQDTELPLIDTVEQHIQSAVSFALS